MRASVCPAFPWAEAPARPARALKGFTLIEVMVALTLGAMVVLAAHQTFGAATDTTARLEAARVAHDTEMRARQWLTVAFASLDVATPGQTGFQGSPERVAFSALPARRVVLEVADGQLVAREDTATNRLLTAERVTFDYLLHTGADEAWVRAWQSPVSAPLAVRLRLARPDGAVDTLLFAIGPRG